MNEPTARQLQILTTWIERGSVVATAAALGIHRSTVQQALCVCMDIFGAANSAQAFAIAVRRGLVDPNELRLDAVQKW